MDIVLCSLAVVVLLPLMAIVALLLKLTSPGPVFYIGRRAGYKGKEFGIFKFRTMRVGSDREGAFTRRGDPRVFWFGSLLRHFKIDELPQLINVIKGDMSIVGPRPEDLGIVRECYTPEQMEVLDVPPGLIGIPEVRYFPDFSNIDHEGMEPEEHYRKVILPMRLELDLEYVRTRTFWLDASLILRTILLILFKTWWIALKGNPVRPLPQEFRKQPAPAEGAGGAS